jgi:hypothetical protein
MSGRHFLIVAVVAVFSSAQADTIYVDDDNCPGPGSGFPWDPYCSIQTAIDNAVDTDEIVVAPGTYLETINFLGKAITLRSSHGQEVTIIDAQQTGSAVTCESDEGLDTVLQGVTVTGGIGTWFQIHPLHYRFVGGGMFNNASSPTVIECTFSDNVAELGGAMYNRGCSPTVADCVFQGNTADAGGGMYNFSSNAVVTGCRFIGNSGSPGGGGGAMVMTEVSAPEVVNCTFMLNWATVGGAIYCCCATGATSLVANCTFSQNLAESGGAVAVASGGWMSLANCVLWDNCPDQILYAAPLQVGWSDVQGGWGGPGNIDADPLFVDPANGDLRLSPGSPCIDAGGNTAVPKGITTDLDGNPRFVDDPDTVDTGYGDPPIVDMGAYELQIPCPWDLNGNGFVWIVDLLILLFSWGPCDGNCPADFDGDGLVGVTDLLDLLCHWGPCP